MGIYRVQHPDMEGQNLHGLCKELVRCVDFPSRENLIQEAHRINIIRNQVAHALLSASSTKDLRRKTRTYLAGYWKLQALLEQCLEEIYFMIKPFNKWSDLFEDDLLTQLIETLDDEAITYDTREIFAKKNSLLL
jgi:hypothetical protein